MRLWSILWRIGLFFLLWGLLLSPIIVPLGAHLSRLFLEIAVLITILIATWIMVRWIDRRRFVTAGFDPRRALRDFPAGLLLGLIWIAASIVPLFLGRIASFRDSPSWSGGALALSGLAILLNAITQEVLARGYFFQVIHAATNATVALLVSSLFFTALHAGAFYQLGLPVLNVFLAGVLFGLAYLLTRNLWLPIGIHFLWNFILGPVLGGTVSGKAIGGEQGLLQLSGSSIWTGGAFGLEGSLAVTIVTAMLCGVSVWLYERGRAGRGPAGGPPALL